MNYYIVYNKETGVLLSKHNTLPLINDTEKILITDIDLDINKFYVNNDVIVAFSTDELNEKYEYKVGYEWCPINRKQVKCLKDEYLIDAIKSKRNSLLYSSDWTQGVDVPKEISDKWKSYREQLRNITLQSGFPDNIIWPEKPV